MPPKPYAESADQNKAPILAVLREAFVHPGRVLEIGAGTGQHAVHFAARLHHLTWQPTDRPEALAGIEAWVNEAHLPNIAPPLALDVTAPDWPVGPVQYVYSANTAHIMDWQGVQSLFEGVGRVLTQGGLFCLYGPFNRNGAFTSPSNERFDAWLKARDPDSGIRDLEALDRLASQAGMGKLREYEMPANNLILQWCKD